LETVAPFKEVIEEIKESGGDAFKMCFQCGLCDSVCPWNRFRRFSMRKLVREATFGLTEIDGEELWLCTTCGRCPERCPRDVQQIASGVALRRMANLYDVYPKTAKPLRSIRGSLISEGNALNGERGKRDAWAEGMAVQPFAADMEILYYPGCYPSFDPRMKKVARATADILNKAGVKFGILGEKESCCGESIRKTGAEELFVKLAKDNIKTFIDQGVKKILVSSPHCYHTFKNEYPDFMVHFEIVHISQYLFELLKAGRLDIGKDYGKKIAYHDPCYLGRHNKIFDEPREVLKSVPGLEFLELCESRMESLCCGGGGGRVWMETDKDQRFGALRLKQALDVGAEELVTCCPYCITMFEDSRITMEIEDKIVIKDITEIIQAVI
jgi:Fe-S oxidoreductase